MSTATIPFQNRGGFFPRPFSAANALSSYDSIALTATSGDEGLAEAIRLYWLLEQATFTPSGTVVYTGFPPQPTVTWAQSFRAPLPDTTGLTSYTIFGDVVGISSGSASTNTALASVEPAMRQGTYQFTDARMPALYWATWNYGTSGGGSMELLLGYLAGSGWRLYYRYTFELVPMKIANPALGSSPVATGTFSFFGYSLSWAATYPTGPDYTVTGIGLTATSQEWTF